MKETQVQESYASSVVSVFHYDFVNQQGKHIKTTKFLASIHDFTVEGTSEKLNDDPLFIKKPHNIYYDGKKWCIVK